MSDFRYPARMTRLREKLALPIPQKSKNGEAPLPDLPPCDTLLVSDLENARYLSGFSGSNALLIVRQNEAVFLTDGRYQLQAGREVPGWEIVIVPQGSILAEVAGEHLKRLNSHRVGFESAHLTVNGCEALKKAVPRDSVELVARTGLVESVRAVKDDTEIAAIRAAITIADACFDFIRQTVRAGMTEKQLAWEMETFMRSTKGAARLSFDSIVGSGPQSALIHGRPSDRVIGASGEPEFLLCDFGCELEGYCSDITRTFVVGGEPSPKQRDLYQAVLRAQLAALEAIKPGETGKSVDNMARKILTDAGYGEAFGHGLGHQLGRVVHDGQAFGQKAEITLEAGMVVTVEPGAYLENVGGVRIEDDVLVTPAGCEILTHSTKDLIVLPLR